VGVVGKDYGNHALPGWLCGTVGYHIDDGRIFDAANSTNGVEHEGKNLSLVLQNKIYNQSEANHVANYALECCIREPAWPSG